MAEHQPSNASNGGFVWSVSSAGDWQELLWVDDQPNRMNIRLKSLQLPNEVKGSVSDILDKEGSLGTSRNVQVSTYGALQHLHRELELFSQTPKFDLYNQMRKCGMLSKNALDRRRLRTSHGSIFDICHLRCLSNKADSDIVVRETIGVLRTVCFVGIAHRRRCDPQ